MDEMNLSVEGTLGWKRFDNTDAYNAGYSFGEGIGSGSSDQQVLLMLPMFQVTLLILPTTQEQSKILLKSVKKI